jgi:2-polyprenyl-6-methoxyphenol hydroxylase-like FAD-dependent oxidoreductase
MSSSQHVIIIGGGLGGLCLAQGLKKAGVSFSVYERDLAKDFRAQGYRIRVNPDGADALKKNLPDDLWRLFEATCATTVLGGSNIDPISGQVKPGRFGPDPAVLAAAALKPTLGPYTADRTLLRDVLMVGLDDNLHFGKELHHYAISSLAEEQKVTAHFTDGTQAEGSLIVGADGLRSAVRRQFLPQHLPVDTDGRCIYGKTYITPELESQFPVEAMKWITVIQDSKPLTLFLEPTRFVHDSAPDSASELKLAGVRDYVYWVLVSRKATFGDLNDRQLFSLSKEELVELSLKLTETWSPAIRSLLRLQSTEQAAALRTSSVLPELPVWTPSSSVTLLGDAVHVMSPTGGSGANTALQDSRWLCQAIAEGGATAAAIGEYEARMRVYARTAIENSYSGGRKLYNQPPFDECTPVDL